MYMQRISIHPRSDHVADVRSLLQERVKGRQAEGVRSALSELAIGGDAPLFVVSILLNDLAAFEALRKRNQSDAGFQAFVGKLSSMERKPAQTDLFEVVVPMPS